MGRKSREKREKRDRQAQAAGQTNSNWINPDQAGRIDSLKQNIKDLCEDVVLNVSEKMTADAQETYLQDIVAFESVGKGKSLFDGLQENGINLPPPEQLNEVQCHEQAQAVFEALIDIGVLLVGFNHMSGREFYRTLWYETLWEGCYIEKKTPGAFTIIDVSHSMSRSDWEQFMDEMKSASAVH